MEKSDNTIKDFAESNKSKDSEDSDKSDSFKNKFADSDSLDNDSKESCIDTHLDSEL